MPNITLIREHLFEAIGKKFTDEEFDELCFEFGVEVDDVETQVVEVSLPTTVAVTFSLRYSRILLPLL